MVLDVSERLGFDIKATEVALMARKATALREVGLTVAQYAALLTLRDNPGITGAGLARSCLVTPQAAAAVLKALEAKGLVQRESDDWNRTARPGRLTPEGARILRSADARASRIEQQVHDALTPKQRASLRQLLETCRAALADD
ncbi:MarR family winged helix-turn-helix transcriptional regulator [Knoellia subterranea]|uniref:MarR family transcriptional regulator n=1 Tax=Knoellia subterranea KCTC 19937 TaxID=1385521 RepID=A0A0A0JHC7_9MICO|nr:MarR family transcriptional regulator [Knoellia subterranea]KGN36498.1 MarR family transcriptional regulator [Knoellia subterranea KCTC 19937]